MLEENLTLWIQKVIREARREGRQEGRREGRQEGRLLMVRTMLLEQMTQRFGRLPASEDMGLGR